MIHYSVYEPSPSASDLVERADRLAFVKDGFSWPALFFPAFWLIYHRMWIELVILLGVLAGLQFAFGGDSQGAELAGWVSIAIAIVFGLEGNDLRAAALGRRGYRLAGIASGRDRSTAELSFFRAWLPQQAKARRAPEPDSERHGQVAAAAMGGEGEEVIGLFPRP